MFCSSISLSKMHKHNVSTMLFKEYKVGQNLGNKFLYYSIIGKGHYNNCDLDPIKSCCFRNKRDGTDMFTLSIR